MGSDIRVDFEWSPDGPGTPFASPWLAVMDVLRVSTIAASVLLMVLSMIAARQVGPQQAARFAALAFFALTVGITEIEHLGDWPSPRLPLNAAGALLGVYGVWRFCRDQRTTQDRPTR